MQVVDFARSFLMFRVDFLKKPPETLTHQPPTTLNNARIQIECHLEISDKHTDYREQFVLGASCKTERVGIKRGIWLEPNADFAPVFSQRQYAHVKTYDRVGREMPLYPPARGMQSDRPTGLVESAFDSLRIDLIRADGESLETTDRIIEVVFNNEPLVAVTEIETDRYRAVLEYPVKTMNVDERDKGYQTDTGPVLLPDFEREPEEMIYGLELAYCAFNSTDWIEFIVRRPTPVGDGISVWHYSHPKCFQCKNRVIRLLQPTPKVSRRERKLAKPHFDPYQAQR